MAVVQSTRNCPECREKIKIGATRCKHCGAEVGKTKSKSGLVRRFDTFRIGFLSGVVFTSALVILVYLHFVSP